MTDATILEGDVIQQLRTLDAESVNCCVTSPPYWSLRRYDAPDVVWGGDPEGCEHEWGDVAKGGTAVEGYAGKKKWQHSVNGRDEPHPEARHRTDNPDDWTRITVSTSLCVRCGAWKGQLGLEPTPELFVEHTMLWLREVRRVLRKDGVCWVNIGDSYAGSGQGIGSDHGKSVVTDDDLGDKKPVPPGLKAKDLVLMPFRVALAAQADGWWIRSIIIWNKPNAMPSSVTDRPTTSHEYVLMLSRSARYWYDQEATRETFSAATDVRVAQETLNEQQGGVKQEQYEEGLPGQKSRDRRPAEILKTMAVNGNSGRNARTVWEANEPLFRLRDDLSPDERSRVLHWLLEHHGNGGNGGDSLEV